MPTLVTTRLIIRPLSMDDLPSIHQILDIELRDADFGNEEAKTLDERRQWLQWTVLNYEQLAKLRQPPYGERAVVLKQNGQLIGACGFVPELKPFEQLPGFSPVARVGSHRYSTEVGLFCAIAPANQRQGYGSEALQAMIDYGFQQLHLKQIVATTTYTNVASIGMMLKLGMRIEKNPSPDPRWLQIVGIRERAGLNS